MHGFSVFKVPCFIFVFAFFCTVAGAFSESNSIFSIEPAHEGDFEKVTVEPNSIDLKNYINQSFDAIRQKNEEIIEFNKKTKKTISDLNKSTRDSIEENKEKIREFLRQGKKKNAEDSSVAQQSEATDSELERIEGENAAIPSRQKFISYCLDNLRGYPYVLGGSSPKSGFDCSGVVQYAARESLGINLPRTAQEMYNQSEKVSADAVLPGDLIFFKAGGKISHVGVYLGTDESDDSFKGKIIFFNSASDPKYRSGTIISSLSEPYWNRHFFAYGKFID